MAWTIRLTTGAERSLEKLDRQNAQRITKFLHGRLLDSGNPRSLGEPLRGPLKAFWKYRVGDFRLICEIQDDHLVVLVVDVGNRREIYR